MEENMLSYDFAKLPVVTMTGRVTEKDGWSHSGRAMPVNLLVIFHSGSCRFKIENREYEFKKGDVGIVPKEVLYAPHTHSFCEYTFFHFNGDVEECQIPAEEIKPFDDIPQGKPSYGLTNFDEDKDRKLLFDYKVSLGNQAQNIELLVRKCVNTRLNYESKQQLLLAIQFSEIMFHISQAFCEKFRSDDNLPLQVNKILTYIKENYTSPITLEDICRQMNLSKQYCMRIFKKHMNTTINDYILDLRMRHAAYLLSSTYMNVNQAADYLGFSGTSYFSRVFKKYYGVAPSDYLE
ncbi:MAG: helix-turn-helix domain-containing protein [Ruminococcaceae bacterium]|nr:helix-turn-helix domain-containing protein [Oscillospiraceae bacterium]